MRGPRDLQSSSSPPTVLKLEQCLAKTVTGFAGVFLPGIDVLTHCLIVGQVAKELIAREPA